MKRHITILVLLFISAISVLAQQVSASYEYIPSTTLTDRHGNAKGEGGMHRYRLSYNQAITQRLSANVRASYNTLQNDGEAKALSPEEVINARIGLTYTLSLSKRWAMVASANLGMYADMDDVSWSSLMGNGGVVFMRQQNERLQWGIGAGFTSAYGVPILAPVLSVDWQASCYFRLHADLSGGANVHLTRSFGERWTVRLTAIEFDGISAAIHVDGRSRLYSSTMIRSGLEARYRVAGKCSVFGGTGGVWLRSERIRSRSISNLYSNNKNKYKFEPSMRLYAGFSYGL